MEAIGWQLGPVLVGVVDEGGLGGVGCSAGRGGTAVAASREGR
jgi:hypothetical protein